MSGDWRIPRAAAAGFVLLMACGRATDVTHAGSLGPTAAASNLNRLTAQSWETPTGDGWSYLRRTGSKDDDIVTDPAAPFPGREALRIIFTPDMQPDSEPGVHWLALPRDTEVYAEWWMKLSSNWTPSPAGGGKVTFLWAAPDNQGQMYTGLFGAREPHHLSVNTEWAPYGQKIWEPNAAVTPIFYDRWYRIAWYAKWPTAPAIGDGILRWWVDDVLDGSYTDVLFPSGGSGFQQFEFAPTLQNPPPADQYMYIGPIALRAR